MSTLANLMGDSPPSQDWGLFRTDNWHLHFCLYPRKCFLTGKRLWVKQCYKSTLIISGWDGPVEIDYYIEKAEFIFWNLKGKQ